MGIFQEQNTPLSIERLRAISFMYSQAKRLGSIRVLVAVLSAAIAPFVVLFVSHSDVILAIVGGALTFICEVPLERLEDDKKIEAARIQEQFDISLFNIPRNDVLVGTRVPEELVHAASRKYKGNYNHRDWYADPGGTPFPLDVLLCQRASLTWDWRQRSYFAGLITLATIALAVAGVLFAVCRHMSFVGWLAAIMAPSLPAITQGIKAAQAHTNNAREKQDLVDKIEAYWRRALHENVPVSNLDCRAIQDVIFILRKTGPMVPDGWFKRLREAYETDMRATVARMREEAEKLSQNGGSNAKNSRSRLQ